MVDAAFFLKVSLAVKLAKGQVMVSRAVLEETATDVNSTDPSVLDDSVSNSRLHCPVHRKFCHQRQCIVVF